MGIATKGLEKVLEELRRTREELAQAAAQAVEVSAEEVAEMAKALCPVETGALRNSITATALRTETGVNATVTCGKAYGAHVEHGTRKMPARPFMYPAIKAYEETIRQRIATAIRSVLHHGLY